MERVLCRHRARAGKDDVGFIDALIERAIAEHGVDPARVYIIGVSRGGWMAYRMATAIPHKLGAFASVLAPMPEAGPASAPGVPLPLLVFGGTDDPRFPTAAANTSMRSI